MPDNGNVSFESLNIVLGRMTSTSNGSWNTIDPNRPLLSGAFQIRYEFLNSIPDFYVPTPIGTRQLVFLADIPLGTNEPARSNVAVWPATLAVQFNATQQARIRQHVLPQVNRVRHDISEDPPPHYLFKHCH